MGNGDVVSQFNTNRFRVRTFGGPTAPFEYGGLRLLTGPTSPAPATTPRPVAPALSTTTLADFDPIDAVLLSHDEHADNLDTSGRAPLADVPLALHLRRR